MTAPVLQFKRGLLTNLPGLRAGEPGFTTDSYDLYVGLTSETATNKFFGSHRYWTKETTSTGSGVNLVESTSQGSEYITLKSPDTLSGITTYTFPATPTDGYFLKTNSTGTLSWAEVVSTFDIAADSGTTDSVSTGATITFTGGTNVNTAVTDDTITINLDNSPTITDLNVTGITTLAGNVNLGNASEDLITVVGVATFTTSNVYVDNQLFVGGLQVTGGVAIGQDITTRHISASGIATVTGLIDGNGGANITGQTELSNANVSVALTATELTVGTGVGITQFSSAVGSGTSTSSVPTSSAVIDYVGTEIGNIDLTITTAEGTNGTGGGGGSVATNQTLTFNGTSGEVDVTVSGQSVTYGLPTTVVVGTAVSVPTVQATNLKANDGTSAITITDGTGAVGVSSDLTISGNLYVNGNTTQVNTTSLTVEDSLIEVGLVNGAAPSSDLNVDLGLLFNYYTDSAKKAGVYWDDSVSRIAIASEVTESSSILTASAYAALEIGSLWVNDCAGQSQVINCSGTTRTLENITIDGGSF